MNQSNLLHFYAISSLTKRKKFGNIVPSFLFMKTTNRQIIYSAIVRILRPLIRILLRNGISYGTFADFSKWLYVDIAAKEFAIKGRKQSVSRISVITGLSRKEVQRVRKLPRPDDRQSAEQYNRAARVISGWRRDPKFLDKRGRPAVLPISGKEPNFDQLVKQYSGDLPFRAILDELISVGAVERKEGKRVRLLTRSYVPEKDDAMKIHILGTDAGLLISTIGHNLQELDMDPFYQRKVAYDNLPSEILSKFRKMSAKSAQSLLERLDSWLSKHDRDINPSTAGTGRNTAGLGIYYFEEPTEKKE